MKRRAIILIILLVCSLSLSSCVFTKITTAERDDVGISSSFPTTLGNEIITPTRLTEQARRSSAQWTLGPFVTSVATDGATAIQSDTERPTSLPDEPSIPPTSSLSYVADNIGQAQPTKKIPYEIAKNMLDVYQLPENIGDNASDQGPATHLEPYWKQDEDPLRRAIMDHIDDQLARAATTIDLSAILRGQRLNLNQFLEDLDAMFFTVRDSNPEYFYFTTITYTNPEGQIVDASFIYNYRYYEYDEDVEFTDFVLSLAVKPEFTSAPARRAKFLEMETEAQRVADLIIDATDNDYLRLRLAHDYVIDRVDFSQQYDKDTNNALSGLLGDSTLCVGYSLAYKMIVERMGFPCISIYGDTRQIGEGTTLHNWNKVNFNDQWYNVDCTWDDRPPAGQDQYKPASSFYFLRSDSGIERSHYKVFSFAVPDAPVEYSTYWEINDLYAYEDGDVIELMTSFLNLIGSDPNAHEYGLSVKVMYDEDLSYKVGSLAAQAVDASDHHVSAWYAETHDGVICFFAQFPDSVNAPAG